MKYVHLYYVHCITLLDVFTISKKRNKLISLKYCSYLYFLAININKNIISIDQILFYLKIIVQLYWRNKEYRNNFYLLNFICEQQSHHMLLFVMSLYIVSNVD